MVVAVVVTGERQSIEKSEGRERLRECKRG